MACSVTPVQFDALGQTENIPIVTCAEMKALEKAADAAGLSYYQMMENAGTCAASFIEAVVREEAYCCEPPSPGHPSFESPICDAVRVLVFCGKGNNGGDGLVVARLLSNHGWSVSVILAEGDPSTHDAISNFNLLPAEVKVVHWRDTTSPSDSKDGQAQLSVNSLSDLISLKDTTTAKGVTVFVDGLYGTGFHGTLRPEIASLIVGINEYFDSNSKKLVFALDLPSGLSGDAGVPVDFEAAGDLSKDLTPETLCLRADYTIAFHGLKPIHLNPVARSSMGRIVVADIGISDVLK